MSATEHVWRPENSFWESVFLFLLCGSLRQNSGSQAWWQVPLIASAISLAGLLCWLITKMVGLWIDFEISSWPGPKGGGLNERCKSVCVLQKGRREDFVQSLGGRLKIKNGGFKHLSPVRSCLLYPETAGHDVSLSPGWFFELSSHLWNENSENWNDTLPRKRSMIKHNVLQSCTMPLS